MAEPEAIRTPDAIRAEADLAELLHRWAVEWVVGYDASDPRRFAALAEAVVEGAGSVELAGFLIKPKPAAVLVCSLCLRPWQEGHSCQR